MKRQTTNWGVRETEVLYGAGKRLMYSVVGWRSLGDGGGRKPAGIVTERKDKWAAKREADKLQEMADKAAGLREAA